jgi:hypothetical protein
VFHLIAILLFRRRRKKKHTTDTNYPILSLCVVAAEERNAHIPDATAEEKRKIRPMNINQEQRAISNDV